MKERATLAVTARDTKGKGAGRRLRATDMVPGIYYDAGGENIMIQAADLPLARAYQAVGSSRILDLIIDRGGKTETKPALIRQIQRHPLKSKITHVDFYGVDLTKEIKVNVPVVITGKAKGLTMGGLLEIFRETVEVACLPGDIPENIAVDVTALDIGDNVGVQDLILPPGVKAVYDDHFAVVGIVAPEAEAGAEEGASASA